MPQLVYPIPACEQAATCQALLPLNLECIRSQPVSKPPRHAAKIAQFELPHPYGWLARLAHLYPLFTASYVLPPPALLRKFSSAMRARRWPQGVGYWPVMQARQRSLAGKPMARAMASTGR
jgi:hypothetical protein